MRAVLIVVCLAAACVGFSASVSVADHFCKYVTVYKYESDSTVSPGSCDTTVVWFGANNAYKRRGHEEAIIADYERRIVFLIDDTNRTYQMVIAAPDNPAGGFHGDVIRSDSVRQFGVWEARMYTAEFFMGSYSLMTSKLWLREHCPVAYSDYLRASEAGWNVMPGFARMLEGFSGIQGISVYSESTLVGGPSVAVKMKMTSRLLEYKQAEPPDSIYQVPDGYKDISFNILPTKQN